MSEAYVDSSWIVAIALSESRAGDRRKTLLSFDGVSSADLLDAEVRSALFRESASLEAADDHLRAIDRVRPPRRLTPEIDRVLRAGFLRGADLWHLACALYLAPDPQNLVFLTLDADQKRVAKKLGFPLR